MTSSPASDAAAASAAPSPAADALVTEGRLPTAADVDDAARVLAGVAVETPLLESPLLNDRLGFRLLVKAEPLQLTGSFKVRGAYNRMARIADAKRANGVVAYSSGNHAQGVAAAAKLLGLQAIIVMPADAPGIKIANTRAWGAEVRTYDRFTESREEIGAALERETGATLVRPYDDPYVIAGQGTVGLELAAQATQRGAAPEAVLVPCGGGGLVSGTALAIRRDLPGAEIIACEPEGFDDTTRSLESGAHETNDPAARSVCDALLAPTPGELTFRLNAHLLAGGRAVSDADALAAMQAAFGWLKLVVEPGGAVALAAALKARDVFRGRTVAVVCSGGNVDAERFKEALAAEPLV